MCSPSRATLLTGRYPAEHGVKLTLTAADLRPDPRNAPSVVSTMAGILRRGEAPPRRVVEQFARGAAAASGRAPAARPSCRPRCRRSGALLGERGYHVAYKGKWHLTHPSGGRGRDARRLDRAPTPSGSSASTASSTGSRPTPARTPRPSTSAAATPATGEGWDEVYTQQVERWLGAGAPAGAVLPGRLARQPPRRPRLPRLLSRPAATTTPSSATSASSCRRPSTRTSPPSPPSTR